MSAEDFDAKIKRVSPIIEAFGNYPRPNERTRVLFTRYCNEKRPAVIFGDLTAWTDEEISAAIKKLIGDFIEEYRLTKEDCFD